MSHCTRHHAMTTAYVEFYVLLKWEMFSEIFIKLDITTSQCQFLQNCNRAFFFSVWVFFETHWRFAEKQGKKGSIFIPLYDFHPLTNIQVYICKFIWKMFSVLTAPAFTKRFHQVTLYRHITSSKIMVR